MIHKKFWIKKVIGFTAMAAAFGSLLSYVVMRLWNGILTEVVHVSPISFLQAIGILILSKILFGGFHTRGGCGPRNHWKNMMKEKLEHMSPEEREKMKEEWRNKCRTWRRPNNEPQQGEQ
jgi:hypothetical protein